MATLAQLQALVTSLAQDTPRSTAEANASSRALAVAMIAITGYQAAFGVLGGAGLGFLAQAQLLQNWTALYSTVFAQAVAATISGCKSGGQAAPSVLAFDTTSATNTVLSSRLTSAIGFNSSSPTTVFALTQAQTVLASTFASQPNQNDATALAAMQTAAQNAVNSSFTDCTGLASFLGVAAQ